VSMVVCRECGEYCDSDFDLDGVWTDTGYICTACTERAERDAEDALQAYEEDEDAQVGQH